MALRRFVILSFRRVISSFFSYGLYLELGYHSEASSRVYACNRCQSIRVESIRILNIVLGLSIVIDYGGYESLPPKFRLHGVKVP